MPFFKTYEVSKSFFDLFLKNSTKKSVIGDSLNQHPMLPIGLTTGGYKDFMVRYYNRSGENPTEDTLEYYPCIVIQDFQPEIDKTQLYGIDYVEGAIDELTGTRERIALPIPMMFKFQVSVVTRRLKDLQSSTDWFLQNFDFQRPGFFQFNSIDTEEGSVGDVVRYNCDFSEVPREDGRFEVAYTFTLKPYIHAKSKTYNIDPNGNITGGNFGDMVEKIKLSLKLKDFSTFEKILQYNFEL